MFYNMAGYDLIRLILVQSILGTAVEYIFKFLLAMSQLVFDRKIEAPEYDYEGTYAKRAVIVALIAIFGSFIPALFFFGLLYIIIVYVIEKFLIEHFYKKSQDTGTFTSILLIS